jgi:hypothetical protein
MSRQLAHFALALDEPPSSGLPRSMCAFSFSSSACSPRRSAPPLAALEILLQVS